MSHATGIGTTMSSQFTKNIFNSITKAAMPLSTDTSNAAAPAATGAPTTEASTAAAPAAAAPAAPTPATMTKVANMVAAENMIISPLLLEAMLALLYLGSDGSTAEELKYLLELKRFNSNAKMAHYYATCLLLGTSSANSDNDSNMNNNNAAATAVAAAAGTAETKIELCNKILFNERYEIADEFQKIAQKYFHTTLKELPTDCTTKLLQHCLNNEIAKIVRAPPAAVTAAPSPLQQSHIDGNCSLSLRTEIGADVDDDDDDDAVHAIMLVIANFKNKWFLPFSAYRSGIYDFYVQQSVCTVLDDNSNDNVINEVGTNAPGDGAHTKWRSKPIPMLFDDDMFVKFGEFHDLDARAIELPYEHDDIELAMLLILPNQRYGLAALEQKLNTRDLNELIEKMQMESVQVLIPKFRIDYQSSLRRTLKMLDVHTIFSDKANFKNLLKDKCKEVFKVDDLIHRVCIDVNENGSDTSPLASNKPIVISNSIDSKKKFFRADHPFYFAILNRDVTYFVGHITTF